MPQMLPLLSTGVGRVVGIVLYGMGLVFAAIGVSVLAKARKSATGPAV